MNPTRLLNKTLLTTGIAAIMAVSSAVAVAQSPDDSKLRTYTDQVSGELKVAPRLLSEMTAEEQAALSDEEKQFLADIEAQIKQQEANR